MNQISPHRLDGRRAASPPLRRRRLRRHEALAPGSSNLPVPWKHILVPLDFSECSRSLLRYAVNFARQWSAKLTLVHVTEPTPYERGIPEFRREIRAEAQAKLKALVRAEVPDGIACDAVARTGRPLSEIVSVAATNGVDLILIGTHGRTCLKHFLLGSVAERVVRHASCPVLVVHTSYELSASPRQNAASPS